MIKSTFSRLWERLKRTATAFKEVDPFTEAASLAFTTIFAVPGVIIIALLVASLFWDAQAVQQALYTQAGGFIGESTSTDLRAMVERAGTTESGLFAKIMGGLALAISATTAFASLQSSLNKIWRVEREPGRAILTYLVTRLTSLALIAALGFLLLISLVLDSALAVVTEHAGGDEDTILAAIGGYVLSFAVVMGVFVLVFKFLPDARIRWRSVWAGALFTTVLFSLGKFLIGLYIARSGAGEAYGAGAAVIIIMLWVYYSSIILLFGAQYTHVTAGAGGDPIKPSRHARKTVQ